MAIADMSIAELRARYVDCSEIPSAHALHQMRRDPRRGVRQLYRVLKEREERAKQARAHQESLLNFEKVLWRAGISRLAGVDEAGVGCLAGPVVAAAVVFPPDTFIDGVDDSKKLAPEDRERLAVEIRALATSIGVGVVDSLEIDKVNIYHAAILAMRRALEDLAEAPQHVLVDAREIPDLPYPQNAFTKGDGLNFTIAAASIIAKTHRDALMVELADVYPDYGFARHKGYATPEHQEAIRALGPCAIHRRSYSYLKELRGEYSAAFYEMMERLDDASSRRDLRCCEDDIAAIRDEIPDVEYRKLRLTLRRRWDVSTA